LRILHLLDHSLPVHSGYTFRTLAILREQRKRGWETHHVTSPKHEGCNVHEEDVEGWHFFRTPMPAGLSQSWPGAAELQLMYTFARRLRKLVEQIKPDVLHAHSPVLNALPALWVGRRLGIPVVYEVRAFWEDAAVDHGTATEWGTRYRLTRGLETFAARRAGHVTTICEGLRNDLVARAIAPEKITVIPNAVDVGAFKPITDVDVSLRRKHGLEGSTVLGFIGSFYAYEGLRLVIETLPLIMQKHANVKLLLVGGGPEESALRKLTRDLGLQERVIFAGRVPNDQVHRFYGLIDLLIYARFSMRLTELVTPLKPLEAMAQGRIFAASDVGGHRELIKDGETGFLFKAGDMRSLAECVERVLSDSEGRQRVRNLARRFVEQERTWSSSVARYETIYNKLIACAQGHLAAEPPTA
jgi:PEP-CTERM/exosortase A-associated glycosyltransferase